MYFLVVQTYLKVHPLHRSGLNISVWKGILLMKMPEQRNIRYWKQSGVVQWDHLFSQKFVSASALRANVCMLSLEISDVNRHCTTQLAYF